MGLMDGFFGLTEGMFYRWDGCTSSRLPQE